MNQEIKAKWVEALRSGEYKQGRHLLRDGDAYCCLGVLCAITKEPIASWQGSLDKGFAERVGIDPHGKLNQCVTVKKQDHFYLASLNDEAKLTFPQIADIIEEQL